MDRDHAQLRRKAEAQGWRVEVTNNNHYKWFPPGSGQMLISAGTSGGGRGVKNHIARMKRYGFKV